MKINRLAIFHSTDHQETIDITNTFKKSNIVQITDVPTVIYDDAWTQLEKLKNHILFCFFNNLRT